MKSLAFIIITKFLEISSSVSKYKLAPAETNCPLLLPVDNFSQTIFIDTDVHAHPELKTCILQHSLSNQPVLLLNEHVPDLELNVTREFLRTSDIPNVMIMTRYLKLKMVDTVTWRFFIRSNWSLLYIIVTDDRQFKCKNDTMNPNEFARLENIMNTLWHRFQIMRIGVVFPFACKQNMVIYNGKKQSTRKLYDRSIKLINASYSKDLSTAIKRSGENLADGYPIQASIFFRYPTSIRDCANLYYYVNINFNLTGGYCGLDAMVMHDILTHLKFNLHFPENKDCYNFGYALPGNVSGALGCIIRNELDISFNSQFLTLYSDEHIYYVNYIKTDTLCALVRKPDIVPLWHTVYNLFSLRLWALIGTAFVAIGGIMWAMAMINKTMTGLGTMTFWWYLHNSVMTTFCGYSPMKRRTFLMLRTSCLVGSIFFLAVYQGHLSRVYTTVVRYRQMKTLEQLYSSGLNLYISPTIKELMRHLQVPGDKQQAEFFDQARLMPSENLGVILQYTGAVTVDRKTDAETAITQRYLDRNGMPLIDILDECFGTYYVSFIARSGFPFYNDLLVVSERLNEAGLPTKYYKWTREMLDIPNSKAQHAREPRAFFKITLDDHRVAFVTLFLGTVLSVVVFAVEIWKGRRH